ncbi:MAG: hypothetical protein V3T83_22870, partial [Acidobacteriota bacterium]
MARNQKAAAAKQGSSWRSRIAFAVRVGALTLPAALAALAAYWAFASPSGGLFELYKIEFE